MSRIFLYEARKLLQHRMLWIFLALFLGINSVIAIADGARGSYAGFVARYAAQNGVSVGADPAPPPSEENEYYARQLAADLASVADPYADYTAGYVAEGYINALEIDPDSPAADAMRAKYERLERSGAALYGTGAASSLYFASATESMHSLIFGTLMGFVTLEGCAAAALIAMLSLEQEKNASTETLIYSTRRGRGLYLCKLAAAIAVSLVAFAAIAAATLAVIFIALPVAPVLGSSVSSVFNYISDMIVGTRPFVTWRAMTVGQYLLASLGISAWLSVGSCLYGFAAQLFCRTAYLAFGALLLGAMLPLLLPELVPAGSAVWFGLMLSPVWLWLNQEFWFTDGGINYAIPHHETAGAALSLLLAAVCAAAAIIRAKRSDILCEE